MGRKKNKLRTNESEAVWFSVELKGSQTVFLIRDGRVNLGPDKYKGKKWTKVRAGLEAKGKTVVPRPDLIDPPF